MDFLEIESRQTLDHFLLVDYSCTPEEVQQHFQSCGTVNHVTILTDKFGQPKGFAYVEFLEIEVVQNAILLGASELHNRLLKVTAKRTNVPGMKAFRGGRYAPFYGYRPRRPYLPPYGKVPRLRRLMRLQTLLLLLLLLLGILCLEQFISGCTVIYPHGVRRGLVSQAGFVGHIKKLYAVGFSSSFWKELEAQLRKHVYSRPNYPCAPLLKKFEI